MDGTIDFITQGIALLTGFAIVVYGIILLLYALGVPFFEGLVTKWGNHGFDVPMSGIAAFAIVTLLRVQTGGDLSFKAFGLEFSGPAGPTTLWVIVFLTIVASLKLLKDQDSSS